MVTSTFVFLVAIFIFLMAFVGILGAAYVFNKLLEMTYLKVSKAWNSKCFVAGHKWTEHPPVFLPARMCESCEELQIHIPTTASHEGGWYKKAE